MARGHPLRWQALAVCLAAAARIALAQTTGNIDGRVTDASGSPLPGVTVEATSPSLQGTRTAVTASDGVYRLPAVPPGKYRVVASLSSFRPAQMTCTVTLDATSTVDLALRLETEAQVVVTGEAPLIDVSSTTTGTSYTSKVIQHLPVSRNYADIVRSNPAVDQDVGETQGRSQALTIYGATSAENVWIIDGINTTNVLKGSQGKAINNEFVQEVEVKTGGYQAEYGRALGGIINVITKSGGNEFHGGAFAYYDSSAMSAARKATSEDSLITTMKIADYSRRDFGADLGGYLLKDRLWFFAAYDRVEFPAEVSRFVASQLVSTDDRFPLDAVDNLYSGKVTAQFSSSTTLVATVFADPTKNTGAAGADPRQALGDFRVPPITNTEKSTWDSTRNVGATDYGLRFTQIAGSSALFTLQGSRHQDRYEMTASEEVRIRDLTCKGGTPEKPCTPPPVENFATGGYGVFFGNIDRSSSHRDQYRLDVDLYPGSHQVRMGADYQDGKTISNSHRTGGQTVLRLNEQGFVYYKHRFWAKSFEDLTPTDVTVAPRAIDTGAYIQDSWRPGGGLTINLGLRWDQEAIHDYLDVTRIKTTGEWQPRLGVVWDPWKDGRTKLYASAGRFYYSLPTDLAALVFGNNVDATTLNFDPVSLTQDPALPGPQFFGGEFGNPVDAGLKGIYQDELTIGVERLLDPTFSIGIKGTYRRLGNVIEDRCDLDYTAPENNNSTCGLMNPGSNGAIARGDVTGCNGIYGANNFDNYECGLKPIPAVPAARRLYRGIEVVARKSFGQAAWLQASYVYSSLRGNYDGEISEGFFQTNPGVNADFDYPMQFHNSYGRLYLDRPHRFRLDGYYTAPFGLSVGLQFFAKSGAPLNKLGYMNDGYGAAVQLVPKGYAGRLPTDWEGSLLLAYPLKVGPATVTLQAYLLNVFNNQVGMSSDTSWTNNAPAGYPATIFDPNQPKDNPEYGKFITRQDPRTFRGAVKISF